MVTRIIAHSFSSRDGRTKERHVSIPASALRQMNIAKKGSHFPLQERKATNFQNFLLVGTLMNGELKEKYGKEYQKSWGEILKPVEAK